MRYGDTYAQLAAGFGIGIATVYRDKREAVEVLAATAPALAQATEAARVKALVLPDGTPLPIGRGRSPATPPITPGGTCATA